MKVFFIGFSVILLLSVISAWYRAYADLIVSNAESESMLMITWMIANAWLKSANFIGFWYLVRYFRAYPQVIGTPQVAILTFIGGLIAWIFIGVHVTTIVFGANADSTLESTRAVSMISNYAEASLFLLPISMLLLGLGKIWTKQWSNRLWVGAPILALSLAIFLFLISGEAGRAHYMPAVYFGLILLLAMVYGGAVAMQTTAWRVPAILVIGGTASLALLSSTGYIIYGGFFFPTVFMLWIMLFFWPARVLRLPK